MSVDIVCIHILLDKSYVMGLLYVLAEIQFPSTLWQSCYTRLWYTRLDIVFGPSRGDHEMETLHNRGWSLRGRGIRVTQFYEQTANGYNSFLSFKQRLSCFQNFYIYIKATRSACVHVSVWTKPSTKPTGQMASVHVDLKPTLGPR